MEIVSGEYIATLYRLIYLFHMPAFIFISGYYSKSNKSNSIFTLLMQYLVFQTLFCLFNLYILKLEGTILYSSPVWILWFSFALIIWKLITPYVDKLKHPIVLSILAAMLAGYDTSIGYGFSLSRILVFYPFFLLGYYSNKERISNLIGKLNPLVALIGFILSFCILLKAPNFQIGLLYHSMSYQAMEMTTWYAGIFRVLILAWSSLLVLCFFALIPKEKQIYSSLGQRTLQVYLLHGFIIKLLGHFNVSLLILSPINKGLFFMLLMLMTIVLLQKPFSYVFKPIDYLASVIFKLKNTST